jgi:hypothetical protein
MEGEVVTPPGAVTVPAGQSSVVFPITAPLVNFSRWVLIQASYGSNGGMHAAVLRVDPGLPATPGVLALGVDPAAGVIGGQSLRSTVGLVTPAPAGGVTVSLSSSDPSVAQVPPSVHIAAGNSANSFTITTSSVTNVTSAQITASAAGTTKSAWVSVGADPNAAAVLNSVTPSGSGATGGDSIPATLFLTGAAPAGGARVTLSSSNSAAAQVPASVTIPAGQGFASFTITTSPVAADTAVTITGTYGRHGQRLSRCLPDPAAGAAVQV